MSQILEQADGLLQALPKEQLGFFPTPFYRLDRLSKELSAKSKGLLRKITPVNFMVSNSLDAI